MQGYNGTIFAYGQTGSGKTFTIQGPSELDDGQLKTNESERGIMQRSFEYIFQNIEAQKQLIAENNDGSELEFLIKVSYLEIYNEQIMDLLEPSQVNLHIREDIKKGVYVEGLNEEIITSYKDMIHLIAVGAKNRHVGSTAMNRESSRSHSVLTTIIESKALS
jgi:kinesin family member 15